MPSLIAKLDAIEFKASLLADDMGPTALAEIQRQMRTATIPEKTGRLAQSLRYSGGDQIWRPVNEGWTFGSKYRAVFFNPKLVPPINKAQLGAVIGKWYAKSKV